MQGSAAAVSAFFLWGVLPLYWKQLASVSPGVIVAQRTLWSLVILWLIAARTGDVRKLAAALSSRKIVLFHAASGLLLASNWLLYVWATLNGHIVEGALGYYLNPFLNMLFGFLWFGERHTRAQVVAISLALVGVALQVPAVGRFPWVALALALTFALYAVVRKRAPLESREGLTVETTLLAAPALLWLLLANESFLEAMGGNAKHALLLVGGGVATTLPLLLFGAAARAIPLGLLGMFQFLGPTLQFLIGWRIYGEAMSAGRLAAFVLIWAAVLLYLGEARRMGKGPFAARKGLAAAGGGG